jgi:Rieske Fe-S protein
MPHKKRASKGRGRKETIPVVGVVGMCLSMAGGASAATAVPTADARFRNTAPPQITLSEEEIADVSLATFYVFDKENTGTPRLGERLAATVRRGCGTCGRGACKKGSCGGRCASR